MKKSRSSKRWLALFFVLYISTLLPIWIMTMTLSVFFSVHDLLIYYVFQPYTTNLETNMLQAILEYNNHRRGAHRAALFVE